MSEGKQSNISIDDSLPGHLRLVVDGDPSIAQPWVMMLTPESAFNLGNHLITSAMRKNNGRTPAIPLARAQSGSPPARRPPQARRVSQPLLESETGPSSSADGGVPRPSTSPTYTAPELLGTEL